MDPNTPINYQNQNSTPPPGGVISVTPLTGNIGDVNQPAAPMVAMPSNNSAQPSVTKAALPPKNNPNSTQNSLHINEVRDGVVIMNDGSYRSVVMLKSINYDLMSPGEREAVEAGYQGFLNSLYFPIQIFVRSRRVDITPYLDKLDKIRNEHDNMLLAMLMEDYIAFMAELAENTNIMDKMFYIVIPFFVEASTQAAVKASKSLITSIFGQKEQAVTINETDLEKAKQELRNRVQAVLNGLQQCGVQGLPLDTQELIELYYDFYNPDTATRQQLKHFDDLTAPVVTKGEGIASQPDLNTPMGSL